MASMTDLNRLSPLAFKDLLVGEGIRRFFLVWDEDHQRVRASHPQLEPLARWMEEDRRDFDRHAQFAGTHARQDPSQDRSRNRRSLRASQGCLRGVEVFGEWY